MNLSILLISVVILPFIHVADAGKRLQLQIIKHQPCNRAFTPSEKIRFSPISKAPLVADPNRDGCYLLSGPVRVRQTIHSPVHIYVDAKSRSPKDPSEKCNNADRNNCGGVGSCVYCDVCALQKDIQQRSSAVVKVENGGKALDCDKGITPGNYSDIKIAFCMPTKDEFLEAEGITDDLWQGDKRHLFFMTIYIFNEHINTKSASELQSIATDDGSHVIGCHRLVGNLYEG